MIGLIVKILFTLFWIVAPFALLVHAILESGKEKFEKDNSNVDKNVSEKKPIKAL